MDETGADTDYRYHFAGLVLDTLDSPVLVWTRDRWLASSLFFAVAEAVVGLAEDTGCNFHSVVQGLDNQDL